jgi:hypothetical protein
MRYPESMTDKISVLKPDGVRVDGLRALVKKDGILIQQDQVLIEAGDLIVRQLCTGKEEVYEVLDPGFHEKFYDIEAGYHMKVRRCDRARRGKLPAR